jgi:pyruvate/2-oxoglutarate dehydrogenase complex dihydrolipoamide dehydrogenase (E3) component
MTMKYDAIVIGTGQSGPFLATRLADAGMKVAIIERKFFGGTCVNTGCIPTKTMVASAYAAHLASRGSEYGVQLAGQISVDMKRVRARMNEIRLSHRKGAEERLRNHKNCAVYTGQGRFESPHDVSVGNDVLSADKIFINVGARAIVPPMPGVDQISYLTNSSILELDYLPPHLVVVGGSYIGLEFGQMFRRFGSEVTVVEMAPRLLKREDEDISAAILDIVQRERINVRLNAKCIGFCKRQDGIGVTVDCETGEPEEIGTHVLLAVGRQPNTDDLGLEKAGIHQDKHGYIVIDDELRTNVSGVWALGDCNGKGGFTHTSYNDFEIVAANLLDNDHRRVSDRIPAYALYIDPPLGHVGMSETQVRDSAKKALIATMPMSSVGRAVEKGETLGFMKIMVDADTRKILGASILGTGGDEVIHSILDVMYAKATYTVIERAMHIHPTVSELIPTLLENLQPLATKQSRPAAEPAGLTSSTT